MSGAPQFEFDTSWPKPLPAGWITGQRTPRIERAALGDRAGTLGAACLAWGAL